MRLLNFFAVVLFFFVSCSRNVKDGLSFGLESFVVQKLNYNDAEKHTRYAIDSLFIGLAAAIKIHPDGFIVIKDIKGVNQILIIDLQNGNTEQFIKRGGGPLDIMSVWDVAIHNGDVWVSGIQESKVIKLSLDKDLRKFKATDVFYLSQLSSVKFMRALPLADGRFLILSDATSGKRMEIVDSIGNVLREAGSFPDIPIDKNFRLNNAFLQSEVTVSPNNEHTAVVCKSIDYIDIYDRNIELKMRLRGPIGAEIDFTERETPAGKRFVQNPMFFMYEVVASNNDMFFVSYNGVEVKSEKDFDIKSQRIFSFDWNGKPLKCYNFDFPVICFDVDWNNKRLYCITENPESEILIFNL